MKLPDPKIYSTTTTDARITRALGDVETTIINAVRRGESSCNVLVSECIYQNMTYKEQDALFDLICNEIEKNDVYRATIEFVDLWTSKRRPIIHVTWTK